MSQFENDLDYYDKHIFHYKLLIQDAERALRSATLSLEAFEKCKEEYLKKKQERY
jgi:hypothetical protein